MKKVLILIFCAALFFAVGGFFLWTALTDDTVFLVPSVLMLLCACVFVYLLIKELFIGYNEYRVDGTNMSVSRRGKLIASIPSSDIADLVIIFDVVSQDACAVSFRYGKRHFYVSLTDENKDAIKDFIKDMPYKKRGNLWYYVLSLIGN